MAKITLFANGKPQQTEEAITVSEFVNQLGLNPATLLIERNGVALLRQEWPTVLLEHGDRLEILRVSAGG